MSPLNTIVTQTKSKKTLKAKQSLNKLIPQLNKQLENYFDQEVKNAFGVSEKEKDLVILIWRHIKEHCLRPAKRLRGSFVYYGYKLLNGSNKKAIMKAAIGIELIHTALLMHDDFMDQDDIRRGLPTTHKFYQQIHQSKKYKFDSAHYGHSMALNTGDIALLLGYEVLARSSFFIQRKLQAITHQLRGIVNTGFGQAFDLTLEAKGKACEQDIFDLHLAKTAIYTYENPLHTGAILGGANQADLELISQYAIPGGVAFQIQDDILGLFGEIKKTGKPAHSDLRQGKMTLLIIKAFEKANKHQARTLKKIWGNRNLTEQDANKARRIVIDTGSLDYSKKISIKWAQNAQKCLPQMAKKGWNKQAIEYLDGIAQYMIERDM